MIINWRKNRFANNSFAVLAAACRQKGFSIIETESPRDDITLYSLNSLNSKRYCDEMADASCITVAGGPHCCACREETAEYADYVVVGEGEYTLPALLNWLKEGNGPLPRGVATRDEYRPADTTVLLGSYPPFSDVKGYIEISRGCPFGCAYCQTPCIFGRRMRHRPVDQIARYSEFYRDVRFVTPNALAYGSDGRHIRLDKVEKLLKSIQGRIYFGTFPSEVRPEHITPESLECMVKYCSNDHIHFGAQSGSNRILAQIRRGHTVEDVVLAVEACRDAGFIPVIDYIFGLPGEDEEDERMTLRQIKWAARFGRVHIHYFMPLPGTPLAYSKPHPLLPETTRTLGQLALHGKATGSWEAHPGVKI